MGQVVLDFKSELPVFDANVALGRRHNRRVSVDTTEGTLEEMGRAGVDRAVVYSPHAASFDCQVGNLLLQQAVKDECRLVPQYVCTPAADDLDSFANQVFESRIRSVRIFPKLHNYPFRDWVVKPWLDWLAVDSLPVWIPVDQFDPSELYDTVKNHPALSVVLSELHYAQTPWVIPLLRSLPNVYVEISRFFIAGALDRLIDVIGERRILFGSRFPDSPIAPQLYNLYRCGLSESTLTAICSGNLERLLMLE